MPDSPDYFKYGVQSVRFSVQDLGELAVRQGSRDWYDRLGNVALLEAFDHGVSGWITQAVGVGSSLVVSTITETQGGYSLLLTAGPAAGRNVNMQKYIPVQRLNRHGLEVAFATDHIRGNFDILLAHISDGVYKRGSFRYQATGSKLQLETTGGAFVDVATGVNLDSGTTIFQHFKFVVDFITNTYVRFIINDKSYDVSAIPSFVGNSGFHGQEQVAIELDGSAAGADQVCLSQVIVTTDEP